MSDLFDVYSGPGLLYASVCTTLDDEAATARMNREHPTGISSAWSIDDAGEFADGTPMPSPCSDGKEGCRHVLFSC